MAAAGGFTPRGSDSAMMIRRPSGELVLDASQPPRPGDEVVALFERKGGPDASLQARAALEAEKAS